MDIIATCRRAVAGLAATCAAVMLAGCVVTSEEPLFSPDELLTDVLPASFEMVTYNESDGVYLPTKEDPETFTLKDKAWVSADGEIRVSFIGIEDPDNYLMAIIGPDGVLYGATGIDGKGIMAVRMVLDGDPDTVEGLPETVTVADGGLMIATRADLEAVFRMLSNGTLPTTPLVAYVGDGAPPTRIVADGDWFRAE